MSDSVTPWTVAWQAPLHMEFSRQDYWSGLLFPILGDCPDPGIEPISPELARGFFTTLSPGKPPFTYLQKINYFVKNEDHGTSLMLQWFKNLHANARVTGSNPGPGTFHML